MASITQKFSLRTWQLADKKSLAKHANNIRVWNNLRDAFPHPYTEYDGELFIQMVLNKPTPTTDFVIDIDGEAVGGIGIVLNKDVERISAEIGYWLSEDYWNKGIMSQVIKQISEYVFTELPIIKIYANVFSHNKASMRVLEKVGFIKEGILKQTAIKNGKVIDFHCYGLLKAGQQ